MQIALFQPDIPQNAGTIMRLCACLDVRAHIIEPAGFAVSDRTFRRAGMDYLDQVTWMRHDSWTRFEDWRRGEGFRLLLFTTKGATDYRDFRLTRMLGVILEDATFDPAGHPSIKEYIETLRAGADLQEAIVLFDKRIVKFLQEQKYFNGFVSEEDLGDIVRMKFLTSSIPYFARWLLMYTDAIRVDTPELLKTEIKALAEKLSVHHQSY